MVFLCTDNAVSYAFATTDPAALEGAITAWLEAPTPG